MKLNPVVSANFLERVAEPSSRFYSDYLAYRKGRLTQTELIARLPHIAMIGDSVCTDVYVSSVWSTFRRARRCCGKNWFLDVDPSPDSVYSVFERLEKFTPLVATHTRGLARLSIVSTNRKIFFAGFWTRGIFPAKSASS